MKPKKYIGYYAHHHGSGHITTAHEVVSRITAPVKLFSSAEPKKTIGNNNVFVHLDLDTDEASTSGFTPSFLHFATTRSDAIHSRMVRLASELKDVRLLMVDVSTEVALLARLLSIPTVIMRMHGDRTDAPHLLAYESAECLIAPYPEILEQDDTPRWIKKKTVYTDGFCQFTGRTPIPIPVARRQLGIKADRIVTAVTSLGGDGIDLASLCEFAKQSPDWHWIVIGKTDRERAHLPPNLIVCGVVDDTWPYLCAADVVVGSAGHNTIMEIATANKPSIIIPEPRPFKEQVKKAEVLDQKRLALTFTSIESLGHENINTILKNALSLKLHWKDVVTTKGVTHIANKLDELYEKLVW